jgi:serine/threonine-protein kinase
MRGDALVGQVLGTTYRLTRLIDQGGMAIVYEAENVRLRNLRYAVKVLRRRWIPDGEPASADGFARFQREAEIISSLRHPNIVRVLDFDRTDDGHPFLVMELLEGEDLDTQLKRVGRLAPLDLAPILTAVGDALQAAHDRGVVHRDLKPANIFLARGEDGATVPKLVDFGISKDLESKRQVTLQGQVLMGTPSYMSPEQARGEIHDVGPASDIFSLATVVYRCLSGQRPFDGSDAIEIRRAVCSSEPRPLSSLVPELPPEIDAVLGRAHAKDRAARYARVEDLVQALVPLLAPEEGHPSRYLSLAVTGEFLRSARRDAEADELARTPLIVIAPPSAALPPTEPELELPITAVELAVLPDAPLRALPSPVGPPTPQPVAPPVPAEPPTAPLAPLAPDRRTPRGRLRLLALVGAFATIAATGFALAWLWGSPIDAPSAVDSVFPQRRPRREDPNPAPASLDARAPHRIAERASRDARAPRREAAPDRTTAAVHRVDATPAARLRGVPEPRKRTGRAVWVIRVPKAPVKAPKKATKKRLLYEDI